MTLAAAAATLLRCPAAHHGKAQHQKAQHMNCARHSQLLLTSCCCLACKAHTHQTTHPRTCEHNKPSAACSTMHLLMWLHNF
jgi:hypothetical protein